MAKRAQIAINEFAHLIGQAQIVGAQLTGLQPQSGNDQVRMATFGIRGEVGFSLALPEGAPDTGDLKVRACYVPLMHSNGAGDLLGLNENHLRMVRRGMFAVCNEQRGTGYGSRIAAEEFLQAGKSGTSQVRNITTAERASGVIRNEDLPWERRDHALFVSFAPFDAPRYAVAVVVEHGGGGSSAAAPIVRDVMLQALYDGTPPLAAYPARDRPRIEAQQERLKRERDARNVERRDRA